MKLSSRITDLTQIANRAHSDLQSIGADDHHTSPLVGTYASANVRNSNDTERTTDQATYTKIKEIELGGDLQGVRVTWDLKRGAGGNAYSKVYKNGSPVGVEKSTANAAYVGESDDLTGFVNGDLLQIYAYNSLGGANLTYVRNMRLAYDESINEIGGATITTPVPCSGDPTITATNNDP